MPIASMPPMPVPMSTPPSEEWDVRRFLGVLQRRALIVISLAAIGISYSIWSALNQETLYQGGFQILVEPVNAENDLTNLTSGGAASQSGLDYDTQISVLKSPELLGEVVTELQPVYPNISYASIINDLSVMRIRETKILDVRYQGEDPAQIQAILEQLSQAYLQYSLNERQTYLRQGIQFVDNQLPALQEQVDSLQDQLQTFRQSNGFIDPDSQTTRISSQGSTLDQQQAEVEQKLSQARSYLETLQRDDGALATLSQSPTYQQLLSQIQQIETKIAIERTRFREGNVNIQVLRRQQDNLMPLLLREASRVLDASVADAVTQIQTLEIQRQAILEAQTQLQQQVQTLPVLIREYANLQRELQIATESLTRFLATRQNLQVEAAQREIPWQVIQEVSQPAPLPNTSNRDLMVGILGSLALGVGAAFLLEKLDSTFHTADELREKMRLPILGVLPYDSQLAAAVYEENGQGSVRRKRRKGTFRRTTRRMMRSMAKASRSMNFLSLPIDDYDSHSLFMEALRVLNANFQMLSSADRPLRSIVISSAMAGDGKSTVALHWARAAVAMGQRVLVVDADLRRPQIHAQLNLNNDYGLSNLIVKNMDSRSVIRRVKPGEELYVMTSGRIPPDPASLLSAHRTRLLIEKASERFDLIIYDTPPLLGLADASLLARHADGLVLVVGLDKTDRSVLQKVLDDLKSFQVPVLGVIANGQRGYHSSARDYAAPPEITEGNVELSAEAEWQQPHGSLN
ncbi:GumC family protein [Egbenema bharatensis]|uniref:GumC family protein n=1 Tax=Egbenema bharatensis TaxID=3463334 RepID=UPI003A87F63F